MKKLKVVDVVNINIVLDSVMLQGVPMDDVKAVLKFRREAKPTVDAWNTMAKDAIEKLGGKTLAQDELGQYLDEALADEAVREVEITPFAISDDAEAVILAQSAVSCGRWELLKKAQENKGKEE